MQAGLPASEIRSLVSFYLLPTSEPASELVYTNIAFEKYLQTPSSIHPHVIIKWCNEIIIAILATDKIPQLYSAEARWACCNEKNGFCAHGVKVKTFL